MEINLSLKKRLKLATLLLIYPMYLIGACVVSPLYTMTDSDISYDLLPVIFKYLGVAIDIFGIYISLAIIIYGLLKFKAIEIKGIIILVLASPLFKNVLKLIVSPIVDGRPTIDMFFMDMYSLSISSVFEILQLAVAIYITYRYAITGYKDRAAAVKKAAERLGEATPASLVLLPFEKILNLKNPLQYGAFVSSCIVTVVRIVMLIIHDVNFGWILYDINTVLLFFGGYLIELVIGALGYFAMLYIFISFGSKEIDN